MNYDFKIIISSDIQFDDLCAEIYFENEFVAILTQERGFDNLEIEIYPSRKMKFWTFKFYEFEKILNEAKNYLWKMRKID